MLTENQLRDQGADDIEVFIAICNGEVISSRMEPYHDVTVY